MSLAEYKDTLYSMVRTVVTNLHGYSINEVLATDIDDLHAVLLADPKAAKEKPIDLIQFVKQRQKGGN